MWYLSVSGGAVTDPSVADAYWIGSNTPFRGTNAARSCRDSDMPVTVFLPSGGGDCPGIVVLASQGAGARSAHQRFVRYESDHRLVPLYGRAATRTPSGEMQAGVIANGPSCVFSFNQGAAILTIG
jgi:hypothetical protein